jgi:hypothetical protein
MKLLNPGASLQTPPPESALRHDDNGREQRDEDGPHDRAAPQEKIDNDIRKQWIHNYFVSLK